MKYDVATAISRGARDYQEDSIVADFPIGGAVGFAVLADGMGGHAAGDVASKIVLTEVYSELKFQSDDMDAFEKNISRMLVDTAHAANECIDAHVAEKPENRGMGSTLVAPIFFGERMYWISIGDSPLYLFRNDEMTQLNEDHSMAPQIDMMVKTGQIDLETAKSHPDRSCLTSVLMGTRIPRIDCTDKATDLKSGDIIVVSSDGLQFLENDEICDVLKEHKEKRSERIAEVMLESVLKLDDPDQDNVSFSIIKIV